MLGDNFPQFNNYDKEDLVKEMIKLNAYEHIKKAIKKYGLEYTEDIIKINYENMPKVREILLKTLYKMWRK